MGITPETAWRRILKARRQFKGQYPYYLPGFDIACGATSRQDLQLRMQAIRFSAVSFVFLLSYDNISESNFKISPSSM